MEADDWNPAPRTEQGLPLSPEERAGAKAARVRRYQTVQIPLFRLMAYALISLVAFLNNRFLGLPGAHAGWFLGITALYSALSALVLRRCYHPDGREEATFTLPVLLQMVDVGMVTLAVHLSGGPRSLLFPLLLIRVADQTHTTFRRALAFALVTTGAYGLMLLGEAGLQGAPVPWGAEAAKLMMILGAGVYLASAARVAEGMRRRTREAIRLSRDLVAELQVKARELEGEKAKALDASQAKSAFLAGMSHEFRTPLNAILLYTELLQGEAREQGRASQARDLANIEQAGQHLLHLVNDLLDLSKIEARKMELVVEPVSLGALLSELRILAEPLAARNGNVFRLEAPEDPGELATDLTRAKQILVNLLGNAAKFTERGEVVLALRREADGAAVFEVRDTGIGMTPAQLGRLFQAFTQAEASTQRQYGGTGLGLALSLQLTKLLEGDLSVESEPGRGTTFRVRLPDLADSRSENSGDL